VAGFLGECNLIPVTGCCDTDGCAVETSVGVLRLKPRVSDAVPDPGGPKTLAIRPERVRLSPGPPPARANCLRGQVREVAFNGSDLRVSIQVADTVIVARVMNDGGNPGRFRVNDEVCAELDPEGLVGLED
jgi:ABC-type Fe3+/spermidine/putrescine transport system ATPase subunit